MIKSQHVRLKQRPLDLVDLKAVEILQSCDTLPLLAKSLSVSRQEARQIVTRLADFYDRQRLILARATAQTEELRKIQVHAQRSVDRIRACLARLA